MALRRIWSCSGASLKKARYDLEHAEQLAAKGFTSETALRDAQVALEVALAREKSAAESLSHKQRANLAKARHDLNEVRITAEMSGVITALNVEEGESAIMGTLNNPGTVLLTIADLSQMEARVDVDETEVVFVEVGQKAEVRLDAYRDTSFAGVVTEVANSARRSGAGLGQESVDFEIVIAIEGLNSQYTPRPQRLGRHNRCGGKGCSHGADCMPDRAGSGTTRQAAWQGFGGRRRRSGGIRFKETRCRRGSFVVDGGTANFRRVRIGIAGQNYFVVQSGVSEGEDDCEWAVQCHKRAARWGQDKGEEEIQAGQERLLIEECDADSS